MHGVIRILHLEDDRHDAELVAARLTDDTSRYRTRHVVNEQEYRAALEREPFDLVLCDFNLRGFDGLAAIRLAADKQPGVPVLVVSGTIDEEEAVACLRAGAKDYLIKDRLHRLPSAVERALREVEIDRARQATEAALRASDARFRRLANQSSDVFWFMSLDPERVLFLSPAFEDVWGVPVDACYQDSRAWLAVVHPDDRARVTGAFEAFISGSADRFDEQYRLLRGDRSVRTITDRRSITRDEGGQVVGASGIARDITELKLLEEQFLQAQKMEAIGRLGGGIAHDFNNLLAVILGFTAVLMERVQGQPEIVADLREIAGAAERASELTRHLLAFSRKQPSIPAIIDLNVVVRDTERILRRVIGENMVLETRLSPSLALVKADPHQVEQVLMNLVVNARDALPAGGRISISTANAALDAAFARRHRGAVPGAYVALAVADNGSGISPEVIERVFEPFFTTKPAGKGTGLGLSTVYGILKQNDGYVSAESVPGQGATFTTYWPQAIDPPAADPPKPLQSEVAVRGSETVLVVEDQPSMRVLVRRMLQSLGYRVLVADDAEQGLAIEERHDGPIHLLLTDIVMPGVTGPDLAQRLVPRRPGIKVLYMSGFAEPRADEFGAVSSRMAFLSKPFTLGALSSSIRHLLDEPAASARDVPTP